MKTWSYILIIEKVQIMLSADVMAVQSLTQISVFINVERRLQTDALLLRKAPPPRKAPNEEHNGIY
jgi:hypothetical protein